MAVLSPFRHRPRPSTRVRRALRVVALGGGTGLPVLLRGLKPRLHAAAAPAADGRERVRLTAIVTAADDGGSSGRLRQAYRVLPPGDIRNCLLALADGDPTLSALFGFRFAADDRQGVGGHSLGNLILTALSHLEDDFLLALEHARRMLAVRGRVLPSTLDDVRLAAEFADQSRIEGESRIAAARGRIRRVTLVPADVRALPAARDAIAAADIVVLGPGSLYTSVIPVLLVRGLADALASSRARVVLAVNLMTQRGETDGYGAADFVRAIAAHAPGVAIHDVVVNTAPVPEEWIVGYGALARPIAVDRDALRALGCRVIERDLLAADPRIRHDGDKLADTILALAAGAVGR